MIKVWKSLSYTTRFSAIAFILTIPLGLFSMGFLGLGLYYTVFFLFKSLPHLDTLHGDWVWPVLIGSGMTWAAGFLFGGITWHYLKGIIKSKVILRVIYIFILWLWAAIVWYILIRQNVEV